MSGPDRLTRSVALLRNSWRQLTSMRTALILLFLLALAAIPGSLLPQRDVNLEEVEAWYRRHPDLAPVVDRLGGFDVYSSVWFSAIYLLLFVSLLGCLVPRLGELLRSLRRPPVDAPRRLSRLPRHAGAHPVAAPPATVARDLHAGLRGRRFRSVLREQPDGAVTVSAEKGYLKETGNLLMHFAMVAVLVGVAVGAAYGWHGNAPLITGEDHRFCNTLQQFDEYQFGQRVDAGDLPAFCLSLTSFSAEYTQDGQPVEYLARADLTGRDGHTAPVDFTVNAPLRLDDANVYLLNEGYAPVLRYTDRYGGSQTTTAMFLPADDTGTAEGVATFPDANVPPDGEPEPDHQVAFQGLYLPTAPADPDTLNELLGAGISPTSRHPQEREPALALVPYRGDLGLDRGATGSLRSLNQDLIQAGDLVPAGEPRFLRPGQQLSLDDGTTVEFVATQRWIAVSVRHDPGEPIVLAGAALLLAGLVVSLTGKRRRVWFRVTPDGDGSGVEAGGLPRSDYPGFDEEFTRLVDELVPGHGGRTAVPEPAQRSG